MTDTLIPRLCAPSSALAMGSEVKMYAWTRISDLDLLMVSIMASVQPPLGLKKTRTRVSLGRVMSAAWMGCTKRKVAARIINVNSLNDACFNSPISDPQDQEQEVKAQIHYKCRFYIYNLITKIQEKS